MLDIKKTYITDSKNKPLAVQVDIKTFEHIERVLEDYALGKLIEENDPDEVLSVAEAREFYLKLQGEK
jgi:hypothetical protein